MAQTSYPTAPSIAIEGMLADLSPHTIESRTNSDSSAQISFGKLVKEDTLAPAVGVQPCTFPTDVPAGIAVHSHAYERGTELDASGVKPTGSINMLRKGPLYVLAGATIATGDRLAYNPTTKKFVPTHTPGDTIDTTAQAVARGPAVANGLFVADFDFTNKP